MRSQNAKCPHAPHWGRGARPSRPTTHHHPTHAQVRALHRTFGHHLDARGAGDPRVQPYAVPHCLPHRLAQQRRHAAGSRPVAEGAWHARRAACAPALACSATNTCSATNVTAGPSRNSEDVRIGTLKADDRYTHSLRQCIPYPVLLAHRAPGASQQTGTDPREAHLAATTRGSSTMIFLPLALLLPLLLLPCSCCALPCK